ncbi:MAG: hypothetical protein ACYSU0_17665 [Planctomycetota bacterium]|jgi:hypothetical protein
MPVSRRGDRRGRDSRRDSRRSGSSRRGERDSRRSGSSRRGERDSGRSEDRQSGRDSGRYGRVESKKGDTRIIVGGVVAAVVVIGIIAIAASGGKKKRRVRRKPVVTVAPVRVSSVDWFIKGMHDGADWKRRSSMRGTFDPKEVDRIADMKTSDYYNKGLKNNAEGQKRYIRGFRKGVLGQ